ncbi:MAG: hypothetical protein ACETWO_04615 [Candidatus Hadarchaeaceae archaeon]
MLLELSNPAMDNPRPADPKIRQTSLNTQTTVNQTTPKKGGGVKMQNFNIFIVFMTILFLASNVTSAAEDYQSDGTYNLKVGDSIKTTNGYSVELVLAWGEMGTRSDWRTDFLIYNPDGRKIGYEIVWDNGTIETDTLRIEVERYVENEALVTVTSLWVHEGDGTYNLKVGDSIKATNGYRVKLLLAWDAFDSRSDWRTDLLIYDPDENFVGNHILWENGTIETDFLTIEVKRYVENEAFVTVTSLGLEEKPGGGFWIYWLAGLTGVLIVFSVYIFRKFQQRAKQIPHRNPRKGR